MVEHSPCKRDVAGSSPITSSRYPMTSEEVKDLLKKINPKNGSQYSQGLYNFLRRNPQYHSAYRDRAGVLYFGYLYEGLFHGRRLSQILSSGRGTNYCYTGSSGWREFKTFWPRYIRTGRCMLDPNHTYEHEGRFKPVGKTVRQCQWCSAKMKLRRWTEKVQRSKWELV